MPMPPRTRGTSVAALYTRRPGLDTRLMPEIVRFRPGVDFIVIVSLAPGRRGPSAIGSVIVIGAPPSPRCLGHAGDLAGVGQLAQADPAQSELAVHRARPATPAATRVAAHLELRSALLLVDQRFLGHRY